MDPFFRFCFVWFKVCCSVMATVDKIKPTPLEDESAVMAVAKEMARTVVEKVVDVATKPRKISKVNFRVFVSNDR